MNSQVLLFLHVILTSTLVSTKFLIYQHEQQSYFFRIRISFGLNTSYSVKILLLPQRMLFVSDRNLPSALSLTSCLQGGIMLSAFTVSIQPKTVPYNAGMKSISITEILNHSFTVYLFSNPWKHQKTLRFSNVSKG